MIFHAALTPQAQLKYEKMNKIKFQKNECRLHVMRRHIRRVCVCARGTEMQRQNTHLCGLIGNLQVQCQIESRHPLVAYDRKTVATQIHLVPSTHSERRVENMMDL